MSKKVGMKLKDVRPPNIVYGCKWSVEAKHTKDFMVVRLRKLKSETGKTAL